MSRLTKTQGILLIAAGACCAALGAYVLLHRAIMRTHADLIQTHADYNRITLEKEHRTSIRALIAETADIRNELTGYLMPADDPIAFLADVEAAGAKAGVALVVESINGEAPGNKPDAGPVRPIIRIVLFAEGGWNNLYHFATLLETMPYAITLEGFSVSETTLDTGYGWKGQIQMTVDTRP